MLLTQGLSHYLEHMLFMGSKKYPDENEYDSYLTKHGGASNAFTELVSLLILPVCSTSSICHATLDALLMAHKACVNASMNMHVMMQEFTNYHFDVKPNALYGALDRFAQFFIDPLCKADALEREVMAVDNEFSGEHSNPHAWH